ncbi:MAG: PEP-CTERM sorting domain-containing protein [Gemmatimonadaceae bacterium]|nr:PEP-CTERM sorting domain-containing protein [Gemmatimonadaceae bacterium]
MNRLYRKHGIRAMIGVVLAALIPVTASAQLITFTHLGGSGSGSLAGNNFFNKAFTITATADLANRTSFTGGYSLVHDAATINIADVGTFTFTTLTRTFVNNAFWAAGFSRASGTDLFNMNSNAAFGSWDMTTSLGPIAGTGYLIQWMFGDIQTSGGILNMNDASPVEASFSAAVRQTPVPEPAAVGLLLAGGALLLLRGARRTRTSAI